MSLRIVNDGPRIRNTNYWETTQAQAQLVYCTVNGGAVRLLVPDGVHLQEFVDAVKAARRIDLGLADARQAHHIRVRVVDGDPADPYVLELDVRMCDRILPASEIGRSVPLLIYGPGENTDDVRLLVTQTATIARAY